MQAGFFLEAWEESMAKREAFARCKLESVVVNFPGIGPIATPAEERWECCVIDSLLEPAVVLATFDTSEEADRFCEAWNSA
jgi:hypothetical protein